LKAKSLASSLTIDGDSSSIINYGFLKSNGISIELIEAHLLELKSLSEILDMKINEKCYESAENYIKGEHAKANVELRKAVMKLAADLVGGQQKF
jgi:hypothetical protein